MRSGFLVGGHDGVDWMTSPALPGKSPAGTTKQPLAFLAAPSAAQWPGGTALIEGNGNGSLTEPGGNRVAVVHPDNGAQFRPDIL